VTSDLWILALKAVLAGTFVVLLSVLAQVLRPKMFAGLFAGAPAVASVSIAITAAIKPPAALQGTRGMIAGAVATFIGILINFSPINPVKALYWSAVINGVVAVPVMITMMHMTENRKIMGKYPVHDGLRLIGWVATAIMTVAAGAMMIAALV